MLEVSKEDFLYLLKDSHSYAKRIVEKHDNIDCAFFVEEEYDKECQGSQHWELKGDLAGWILTSFPLMPFYYPEREEGLKYRIMLHSIDDLLYEHDTDNIEEDFEIIKQQLSELDDVYDVVEKTLLIPF